MPANYGLHGHCFYAIPPLASRNFDLASHFRNHSGLRPCTNRMTTTIRTTTSNK
jgi:hypothetical protein